MADKWLVFVDTNIFLDLYRLSGESAKKQLAALEKHKSRLIISEQIRMEFLKNRQKVILQALDSMKAPVDAQNIPAVLSDFQAFETMKAKQKDAKKQYSWLYEKTKRMITSPVHNDPILASFKRIYKEKSDFNLCRPNKRRFAVRHRARKRFALGYPPRKGGDTSFGDAVMWEWIIECAIKDEEKSNVVVVSRDSDYGSITKFGTFINDWLEVEFKERVSRKRKIQLSDKLTSALRLLDEDFTDEEVKEEERINKTPMKLSPEFIEHIQRIRSSNEVLIKKFAEMKLGLHNENYGEIFQRLKAFYDE